MNDRSSTLPSPGTDAFSERAGHLKDQILHTATLAKDIATDGVRAVQQKASSALHAGTDHVVEMKDRSVLYIQENPLKTVLMAVGIGALAGMLLARRR